MSMSKNVPPNSSAAPDTLASREIFDDGMKLFRAQLASASSVPQALWQANFAMMSELFAFMSQRIKAQAELCSSLGRCKELSEAVDAQRAFAEGVTGDYSEEVGKLSDIARANLAALSAIGSQATSAWKPEAKLVA